MNPYICVTYAHDDRQQSELFFRSLSRYGFRYNCVSELSTHDRRGALLGQSAILIALTSEAASRVETVASDIRHALEKGLGVLCVSLKDNELDHRFCTGTQGGAVLIPFPAEDLPDRHALALFVHRLYVRHLARLSGCFMENRCDDNVYGQLIRCAYYAHAGDNDACFELGRAYELGVGVPALEKEAAIWLKRAADHDVCDALIRMGCLYLSGTGTERNPEEAFRLFTRAAELGDIRGVYHRGLCYLEGHGVMTDPIHAIECLKSAACTQHAPSLYRLAVLHRDGIGTERDVRVALKYLYAVCCLGYAVEKDGRITPPFSVYRHRSPVRYAGITMRQMRHAHLNRMTDASGREPNRYSKSSADRSFGRNTITARNLPEDRWARPIAELYASEYGRETENQSDKARKFAIYESDWSRADAAQAAFDLGCLLAAGSKADRLYPSPTRALVWYRYAARLGHTEALYALGDAYRRGFGTPIDIRRAVDLFRLAAEGGSERGRFAYAVCCERGIGIPADPREAFRFYELAAVDGYAPAQNNLGGCYEYALGTPQNLVAAVEWYASAANAGQCDGQCRLGLCYELGRGVSVDMDKAIRLYELAADHGHAYALYRRALCYDRGRGIRTTETGAFLMDADGESASRSPEFRGDTDGGRVAIDHTRAAALYQRAADMGVPESAYAFYLCHRLERGLARDERDEILYLRRAAEGGCLQAAYELGLCYMEGSGLPKDQAAAVAQFARTVDLWRACSADSRTMAHISELDGLPPDALSPRQAAGGALYMLAYCTLYGLGEANDNREVDPHTVPTADRVASAVSLLRKAADIGHAGSLVMLGDLYAYGLLPPGQSTPEDQALAYYLEAVQIETNMSDSGEYACRISLRDPTDQTIPALMSLAERALDESKQEHRPGDSEIARVNAWRSYSEGAARGSTDALVAMAECLYFGTGTSQNPDASLRLLRRAESLDGGRISAALWLGDALRRRDNDPHAITEADEVYLRGLERPCRESESGPYTLGLRRVDRKRADIRARSEILYRLATLRAVHFSNAADHRDSFLYLAEAILMGHAGARDDLARMFAFDSKRPKGPALKASRSPLGADRHGDRRGPKFGHKAKLRRRIKENGGMLSRSSGRALRIHQTWLCDYYTALYPMPEPFSYAMQNTVIPSDAPEYTTIPVTDLMRANALQYLGECFFEGYGLPSDAAAAVTCYRAVLACAPKGGPTPPASVAEATYSLGWCLLHGVGTPANHREAIRLLTSVSRSHPGACFTLGLCHEEGLGVVAADDREALKFYRKAQRLGHPKAADKVAVLEKRLLERAN